MIKSAVLAAVAVVGIGSAAEAATVSGSFTFTYGAGWNYDESYNDREDFDLDTFWGAPLGTALTAVLEITETSGIADAMSLFVNGQELFASEYISYFRGVLSGEQGTPGLKYSAVDWNGIAAFYRGYDDSSRTGWLVSGTFTPSLAPVPVPASIALMPLGLGALAMMRKRRKRVR